MMLLRLAWRNIWRNWRRSALVLASIVVGCLAIVFTDGLLRGYLRQVYDNQLLSHTAHLQVHRRGFNDNRTAQNFMESQEAVRSLLRTTPAVRASSGRVLVSGLLSSASASSGVMLVGVDPAEEPGVTTIAGSVVEGRYLSGGAHEILIGRRLAETLGAAPGDRLVAMASASDGTVGSEMFRIVGLYQTASSAFDRAYVFVGLASAQQMLRVGSRVAEVAVLVRDIGDVPAVRDTLASRLGPSYEVLTYHDLLPAMLMTMEMAETSMRIVYAIIGLAMLFGIINTMLMSVFERIHEFGVLKAVGMRDRSVFVMVLLEAACLGGVGTGIGTGAGVAVTAVFSAVGLNFARFAEGLAAWGAAAVIYPVLDPGSIATGAGVILAICIAAAAYPALRAVRLLPVSAIRYV